MEDLLVHVLRESERFSSLVLTLQEGEKKIFGRGGKEMTQGWIGLPSSEASQKHFQIVKVGGKYFIEDCKSKNGTFVNGLRITGRKELTHEGAIIQPGAMAKAVVEIIPINSELFPNELTDGQSYCAAITKESPLVSTLPMVQDTCWKTKNPQMKEIFKRIQKVACTSYPILLQGEPGTGKGTLAQAIHRLSGRQEYRYFNASELNGEVGWDRLTGHCRGSFTGAVDDSDGILKNMDNGTFFLDEVDSLGTMPQARLLSLCNFEEEYDKISFYKKGETKPQVVHTRLITATARIINKKRFRSELLDRISVIPITIPPLRARIHDDFEFLFDVFAEKIQKSTGLRIQLTSEAKQKLLGYSYPGNVRELQIILVRASVCALSELITEKDIEKAIDMNHAYPRTEMSEEMRIFQEGSMKEIEKYCIQKHATMGKTKTQAARLLYGDKGPNTTKLLNCRLREYELEHLWRKGNHDEREEEIE